MAQTPLKVNLKENLRIKDQEAAHLQALSETRKVFMKKHTCGLLFAKLGYTY